MASLGKQAAARCAEGQLALGDGEDGFNQGAAAVFLAGKVGAHLGTNAMKGPSLFPAFGGDDAQSMKMLTDKGVIALGIELGISQRGCAPGLAPPGQGGWHNHSTGPAVPTAPR